MCIRDSSRFTQSSRCWATSAACFARALASVSLMINTCRGKDDIGHVVLCRSSVDGADVALVPRLWAFAQGADVDARTRSTHETPLHKAGRAGAMQAAQLLVNRGASIVARDNMRRTAYDVSSNLALRQWLLPLQMRAEAEEPSLQAAAAARLAKECAVDARRLLLKGQLKEGTAALEKLRNDLLMYFRDATP